MMAGLAAATATGAQAQVAPLAILTAPTPMAAQRTPLLAPIALGGTLDRSTPLTARLRLRVATMTTIELARR